MSESAPEIFQGTEHMVIAAVEWLRLTVETMGQVHGSITTEGNGEFSFRRRCYALVSNFASLLRCACTLYLEQPTQVIAQANAEMARVV